MTVAPSAQDDDDDGWFGDSLSFTTIVEVRTSYRDIREDQLAEVVAQDEIDLWKAFRPRIEPAFAGVLWWEHLGFDQMSEEPPHWGVHVLSCRWVAEPNP